MFKDDGGRMLLNLTASGINGVAKRLSVLLLQGPAINPLITGQMALEAKNDVNKKSAFLKCFKRPLVSDKRPETVKAAMSAIKIQMNGGRASGKKASIKAPIKPPR